MPHPLQPSIGIVIPTFKAAKHLHFCLPPLVKSPLNPRILIIDSSSDDETLAIAQHYGVETMVIAQKEFNHGKTREIARAYLKTDIVVMLTQDAYPESDMIENLVLPIIEKKASIAYARQIPHDNADFFESFPREFNYPANSHIRSLSDAPIYGAYTFFCSNSCAAYSNKALDEIGGFQHVLFGEDTVATANLLKRGHKIAYVAEAIVKHSHRYSLIQEFKRHFDIGIARAEYKDLINIGGKDEKRGREFVSAMLGRLKKEAPQRLPYAFLQIMSKWLGYRIGSRSTKAPLWLKKTLSSQGYYWK